MFALGELKLALREEKRIHKNITQFKQQARQLCKTHGGVIDAADLKRLVKDVLMKQPREDLRQKRMNMALQMLLKEAAEVNQFCFHCLQSWLLTIF